MKAVVCQNAELRVEGIPEPVPGTGQVLVAVERCGICGSDLHMRHHCDHMKELLGKVGAGPLVPSSRDPFVFGHEFCCEVLDFGPACERKIKTGTRVVSQPMLRVDREIHITGLSPVATGGFAERMLLQESALVPVPNGLSPDLAARTEPIAVALHAVRRGEVTRKDVAIVVGCGPVGLAVICVLKSQGVATVVASDLSAGRRDLTRRCGADVVIDPREGSPYADRTGDGHYRDLPALIELSIGTQEKLRRLPVPWHVTWRLAEKLGVGAPKRPVIFECVGVPGIVQQIVDGAPLMSRVVVAGVCMQVMFGQTVWAIIYSMIFTAIILGVTAILFDIDLSNANLWGGTLMLLAGSLSFIGVGIMGSVLPLLFPERGSQMTHVLIAILLLVSGVYYPVNVLPPILQRLAVISPATYVLDGTRLALLEGIATIELWPYIWPTLLMGLFAVPAGLWVFKLAETYAKRNGKLHRNG